MHFVQVLSTGFARPSRSRPIRARSKGCCHETRAAVLYSLATRPYHSRSRFHQELTLDGPGQRGAGRYRRRRAGHSICRSSTGHGRAYADVMGHEPAGCPRGRRCVRHSARALTSSFFQPTAAIVCCARRAARRCAKTGTLERRRVDAGDGRRLPSRGLPLHIPRVSAFSQYTVARRSRCQNDPESPSTRGVVRCAV